MIQIVTSTPLIYFILLAVNPLQVRQVLQTRVCPRCDLSYAKLGITNLRGADLRGANLQGADLKASDLREANLAGANLFQADLRSTNLTGAILTNADLTEAILCNTTMPDGKKVETGCPQAK